MENKVICAKCKGKCCKTMGCHFSPDDFREISYESLKKKIDEGNVSIDWWEGHPLNEAERSYKGYYLRMRHVDADIVDPSYGGRCALLTDTGCPLEYKDRPKGARTLIPREEDACIVGYDKQQCAIDWLPYNDILGKLADEYKVEDNNSGMFSIFSDVFKAFDELEKTLNELEKM